MEATCCPKCHQDYNKSSRKPRILIKCGHTICSECILFLINQKDIPFSCPFDDKVSLTQTYEGFITVEDFPVNVALVGLLRDESVPTMNNCPLHSHKPLDYYCLQCYKVICADCYIFGDHKSHKLSKKKELKDLNGFLIAQLDKVYNVNKMFKVLHDYQHVGEFFQNQTVQKLNRIQKQVNSQFEVKLLTRFYTYI